MMPDDNWFLLRAIKDNQLFCTVSTILNSVTRSFLSPLIACPIDSSTFLTAPDRQIVDIASMTVIDLGLSLAGGPLARREAWGVPINEPFAHAARCQTESASMLRR